MQLDIIAPDKKIFSGEIEYIQLPGIDGLFGVLKDHAPIISGLKAGVVTFTDVNKQEHTFSINGGVAEVNQHSIIVLAD